MPAKSVSPWNLVLALVAACALGAGPAAAQFDFSAIDQTPKAGAGARQDPVAVQAHIAPAADGQPTKLVVTADVAAGWHIYSLTQKRGGPIPTKITLDPSDAYKLASDFTPDVEPEIHTEAAFDDLPVETHEGKTVWTAPLEIAEGTDPAQLSVTGKLAFQACDASSCLPPASLKFTATYSADAAAPAAKPTASAKTGEYTTTGGHFVLRGYVEPKVATAGEALQLVITVEPAEGWHVYALAERDPQKTSKPTLIVLSETSGYQASPPVATGELIEKESAANANEIERYYEKAVMWRIELAPPAEKTPDEKSKAAADVASSRQTGEHKLAGLIGLQTCEAKGCDIPQGVKFEVTVPIGEEEVAGQIPLTFSAAKSYRQVAEAAAGTREAVKSSAGFDASQLQASTEETHRSLLFTLGAALLGGLILNCMPCVLPVIGLKILGFVEQSNQHRRRVFALNMWFALGLLSVFVLLASLAVFLNLGWGEQFTKPWFTIGMAGLVFAMALSFLGVWEIPIPGFVGSGTAGEMAAQEGAAGAFAKGVFTTILATPCSGPFLAPVFGWLLGQPPAVVYAAFLCVGLGMASPYLLIGAFPSLIRFLPKPGMWMDTLKQLMGFVLLGTVVFLFMSIKQAYVIPALALLMGIWFGCWFIGRTPLTAELGRKFSSWVVGCAMAAAVGLFAFTYLVPGEDVLHWQPFSREALTRLTAEGKTVFVDFTADWCATCKTNERLAINTQQVSELIDEYGIVPLKADWTEESDEIKEMLHLLGRNSIPVYAVFPAGRPNQPIVFSDLVTKSQVIEKLRQAGPSRSGSTLTALKAPR